MKRAKRYPFLLIQKSRFILNFQNQSSLTEADGIPTERDFYRWIWHAFKAHYHRAEIALVLLNEEDARIYNRDFRQKDYATNILSFEERGDELLDGWLHRADTLYGQLLVCPQVVLREAAEQGKSIEAHFAHMSMHGTLHLMGYDHLEESEAEEMESLEIRLLSQLAYLNPYESVA